MRAWRAFLTLRGHALLSRPGDLAAGLLGDLVVALSGLLVIAALFSRTTSIAGFGAGEVLVAWGLAQAALGLAQGLFAGLFVLNRRYLLGGELERVLLRPLDAYAQVMAEHLDPGGLVRVIVGFGVVWWGAARAGVALAPTALAAVCAWTLGGALLIAGVLTAAASLGFRIRHEGSAVGLIAQFQGLAHVPLPVLPVPFAAVALTVLPFALTGFVPAMALCGRPEWTVLAAVQPAIGLAAFVLGRVAFARGLARYGQ
jgi:ABC-2 type transport system permease protein